MFRRIREKLIVALGGYVTYKQESYVHQVVRHPVVLRSCYKVPTHRMPQNAMEMQGFIEMIKRELANKIADKIVDDKLYAFGDTFDENTGAVIYDMTVEVLPPVGEDE